MPVVGRTFRKTFAASPDIVGVARSQVAQLAAEAGAPPARVDAIRLAVSEAVTNAIVHGYHDGPGEITVTAVLVDDGLSVMILDAGGGPGATAVRPGLGLGLELISRLSDDFSVVARPSGGTEVRIRFRLADRSAGRPSPYRGRSLTGSGHSGADGDSTRAAVLAA